MIFSAVLVLWFLLRLNYRVSCMLRIGIRPRPVRMYVLFEPVTKG